jgi:uncharacterized protein
VKWRIILTGTLVNTLAIVAGSIIGLLFRGGISAAYRTTVIHAVSLAVVLIGLQSALKASNLLLVISSLAIGSIMGEWMDIEGKLEKVGGWFEVKFSKAGSAGISKGFVTASLIFCVGSMAVIGSLESGLTGNHQTLFAKSILDGISSVIFASAFGAGVLLSAISVFIYQGLLTVTATMMRSLLTPEVVNQMTAVGGLLILAIGLNLLEITKIRTGNLLPAIFIPPAYFMIKQLNMVL